MMRLQQKINAFLKLKIATFETLNCCYSKIVYKNDPGEKRAKTE